MFKYLIIERILAIVKNEGGQEMKKSTKWKNVQFRKTHIADLTNNHFANGWITDSEILDFYDLVNKCNTSQE